MQKQFTDGEMADQLRCLRCGHEWVPRVDYRPRRCPNCASPAWHKPPIRKPAGTSKPGMEPEQ